MIPFVPLWNIIDEQSPKFVTYDASVPLQLPASESWKGLVSQHYESPAYQSQIIPLTHNVFQLMIS